jgi:hypothetical protein
MQGMIDGGFRPIVRAYALSIAVWCGLSLLTGVQYRIFDKQLNIQSSRAGTCGFLQNPGAFPSRC